MNEIISINVLYALLDKNVQLAASFTDKKELSQIITMCRLKPYNLLYGKYSERITLYYQWIDESDNQLSIGKDKKIQIKLNCLFKKKQKSTDLYENLSIDKVARISKLVYFLNGKEEDMLSGHNILSFLGIDNFLRTFVFIYGEWQSYPSLYLGVNVLTEIVSNIDLEFFKETESKKTIIYPCVTQKAWISSWPPHGDFISILNDRDNSVTKILNIK